MDKRMLSFVVLAGLLTIVVGSVWSAYVVTVLWAWFMVPFGLPMIGKAHAYGLVVLVSILTIRYRDVMKGVESSEEKITAIVTFMFIMPLCFLLCGWVAHMFM